MADDFTPLGRSEDYPGNPQGYDRLLGELRDIRTRLSDLPHGLLRQAGISVEPDRLVVGQSLDVEGALRVTGATLIEGPLTLQPGSIENDALANPLYPASGDTWDADFGLTTTSTTIVQTTIPIPAGFSKAVVTGLGSIFALNPTANVDYLYARVYIDVGGLSKWGIRPLSMIGPNNGSAALAPNRIADFDITTETEVVVRLEAYTAFASMSSSSNLAGISAQVLFFR